jgi:hypothetical protein
VYEVADGSGGDDFRGVEEPKDGIIGEVETIHARTEAVVEQPGADVFIAERAILDAGAMRPKLRQIHIDDVCIGHRGPLSFEVHILLCRAERIGQPESSAVWED